jgi:adenine deaminase
MTAAKLRKLIRVARGEIPGFLAPPVIPELKITDHGLVDVNRFKMVSLFN